MKETKRSIERIRAQFFDSLNMPTSISFALLILHVGLRIAKVISGLSNHPIQSDIQVAISVVMVASVALNMLLIFLEILLSQAHKDNHTNVKAYLIILLTNVALPVVCRIAE